MERNLAKLAVLVGVLVIAVLFGVVGRKESERIADKVGVIGGERGTGDLPRPGPSELLLSVRCVKDRIAVGEPLVAWFSVSNTGSEPIALLHATPERLKMLATADARVLKGDVEVCRVHGATVHAIPLRISGSEGTLPPGSTISADRIFVLWRSDSAGRADFLREGVYDVVFSVGVDQGKNLSASREIEVVSLEEFGVDYEVFRQLFVPVIPALQRPFQPSTKGVRDALAFAIVNRLPHREYLEFHSLEDVKGHVAEYRSATQSYLERYPSSPYEIYILYNLAFLENQHGLREEAKQYAEQLLEKAPNTLYSERVKQVLR